MSVNGILFIYQKFYNKTIQKRRRKRNVLLYCASDTMLSHIRNYYNQLESDSIRLYFYFGDNDTEYEKRLKESNMFCVNTNIVPVLSKLKLVLTHWDLIVTADLGYEPIRYSKEIIPILYVNHGSHIVSINNEGTLYAYGKGALNNQGKSKFTVICEHNYRIAEEIKRISAFKDVVVYTGAKDADLIKEESVNYYRYRKQLGINEGDTFVAVFSTWRKESLFQYLGEEFLEAMKRMKDKGFVFCLSVHPKEYSEYEKGIKPFGPILKEFVKKGEGFILRDPKDDYIPYLIGSDIVICDYSSLYENALLAGKKLIFSEFPDYSVGKLSIAYRMKRVIPILTNENILSQLEDVLMKTKNEETSDVIYKYADEIYSGKAEYKRIINNITNNLLGFNKETYL